MSIIVGLQPNIMRGRLMGYDQTDLTTFGGFINEGETPYEAALRELKEEANIDHIKYKSLITLLEGTSYCFEIKEELEVSSKSSTEESVDKTK
jgi:8-oxo-dGTP pyrophosphatase MutT (NUDIX family)